MNDKLILKALTTELKELYDFGVVKFGFKELQEGYIKCQLCIDVRKHIAQQTCEFKELRPREFLHLSGLGEDCDFPKVISLGFEEAVYGEIWRITVN